jgi:hypothetical protein
MKTPERELLRIGPRKPGVPTQAEMYQLLKQRSKELQAKANGI